MNNFIDKDSNIQEVGESFQFVVVGDQAHGYRFNDIATCNKFKEVFNYCKNFFKEKETESLHFLLLLFNGCLYIYIYIIYLRCPHTSS